MGCSASNSKQVKQPLNPPANPAQRQQPAQQNKGANPQSEPVKKEENKKVEKVEKDDKVAKEKSKTKNEGNYLLVVETIILTLCSLKLIVVRYDYHL